MRQDVLVPNESDAFVFASASLRGRGLESGSEAWRAAVARCELLPFVVESEDPAIVRVVVGGSLDADEEAEWVGRIRGGLHLPDGRLMIGGGVTCLMAGEECAADFTRIVEVPPGSYHATVTCHVPAPNGRACLDAAGGAEPLGAWFRRTRPGQEMPAWLHDRCVNDPSEDPGHEKTWRRAREKGGPFAVSFVLHLVAAQATELSPAPVGDDGFAEAGDCRKPQAFPLGLASSVASEEAGDDEVPAAGDGADIRARCSRFALHPIAGGPVDVPVAKLARVFRIAWMCQPYTLPELRIQLGGKARVTPPESDEIYSVEVQGRAWTVRFADRGQSNEAGEALAALAKQLGALPDGSVIELDTARPAHAGGPRPVALHRYRGIVEASAWKLSEAFPAVDAARLTEALALTALMEGPRVLVARDEAEAARIEERVRTHAADFLATNPLQRSGAELSLHRRDPAAMAQVALRAFRMRYADTWPLHDADLAG